MALKGLLTTVSLVALAALPAPTTTVIEPEQPAAVAAIEETATPIVEEQPVEVPAPEVVVFNAADRSTWPACAEGEIVRADNGQCAVKYVPPEPTKVAAKATPQKTTQAAIAPVAGGFLSGCDNLRTALARNGLNSSEISAAIQIATRESGCRQGAVNPTSGACNVFQEYTCGKWGGRSNLDAHIRGADAYAKNRYGGWQGALAAWRVQHWW